MVLQMRVQEHFVGCHLSIERVGLSAVLTLSFEVVPVGFGARAYVVPKARVADTSTVWTLLGLVVPASRTVFVPSYVSGVC